ncbi:hypothetical protein F5B18DRAFT_674876 [Nemania serpens]|nr:hypothetical protein F5B18DRAFT_674876 [Nemania serpens]
MTDYAIDSYFLNVENGDSAVHVLYSNTGGLFKFEAAVLIDGGQARFADPVHQFLVDLRDTYYEFRLTAVVITHWDNDHYGGIMTSLQNGNLHNFFGPDTVIYFPATDHNTKLTAFGFTLDQNHHLLYNNVFLAQVKLGIQALGVDVFSGQSQVVAANAQGFADIFKADNTKLKDGRPILLCIAVDGIVIGSPALSQQPPPPANQFTSNDSSIALVAVWPDVNTNDPVRISLYSAGDSSESQERALVYWLRVIDKTVAIDVAKLSHHGSASSTPGEMVTFGVQYFVISAGHKQHGHPAASLLTFIMAWAALCINKGLDGPHIFASCEPYWFNRVQALGWTLPHFNLKLVLSYDYTAQDLRAELLRIFENADILAEWFSETTLQSAKDFWCLRMSKKQVEAAEAESLQVYDRNTLLHDSTYHTWEQIKKKRNFKDFIKGFDILFKEAAGQVVDTLVALWHQTGRSMLPRAAGISFMKFTATADKIFYERTDNLPSADLNKWETYVATVLANRVPAAMGMNIEDDDDNENHQYPLASVSSTHEIPHIIAASPPPSALAWLYSFLGKALATGKAQDGALLDFELTDPDDTFCGWFDISFGFRPVARFSGLFDLATAQVLNVDDFALYATIGFPQFSGLSNSNIVLSFSATADTYRDQFGQLVVYPQFGSGFEKRLSSEHGGFIFALDRQRSKGSLGLDSFLSLFSSAPNSKKSSLISSVLKQQQLVPRLSTDERPSRSGIWMLPSTNVLDMCLRLEMVPAKSSPLEKLLNDLLPRVGIVVNDATIWGCLSHETAMNAKVLPEKAMATIKASIGVDLAVSFPINGTTMSFESSIVFSEDALEFQIRTKGISIETIFKWIADIVRPPVRMSSSLSDSCPSLTPVASSDDMADALKKILRTAARNFKLVAIRLMAKTKNNSWSLSRCCVDFEIDVDGGRGDLRIPIQFIWQPGTYVLTGHLPQKITNSLPYELDPKVEWVNRPILSNPDVAISISSLLGISKADYPSGVPDEITRAEVSIRKSGAGTRFSLGATISCVSASESDKTTVPALSFDFLSADVSIDFAPSERTFSLALSGGLSLHGPGEVSDHDNWSDLAVFLAYNSAKKSWEVAAEAHNVRLSNLYSLFAADSRDAIADVFSRITILSATFTYAYVNSQPSSLNIAARFLLGPILLQLDYEHANGKDWKFEAHVGHETQVTLNESKRASTLGELLGNLFGQNEALPDFIKNLNVPLDDISLHLKCESVEGVGGMGRTVIFCLTLKVGDLELTFAQLQPVKTAAAAAKRSSYKFFDNCDENGIREAPFAPEPSPEKNSPVRMLRFALREIPGVDGVPVVGKLAQPIDELAIVWVNRDVTVDEATVLNREAFPDLPLLFKKFSPDRDKQESGTVGREYMEKSAGTDVALVAGCHFQVAKLEQGRRQLLLDHVVGHKKKKQPKPKAAVVPRHSSSSSVALFERDVDFAESAVEDETNQSLLSVAPMRKQIGPLSISHVALQVSNDYKSIGVVFTATLKLGALCFSLIELGLSLDLTSVKAFSDFMRPNFTPTLSGLALAFEKPPKLTIEALMLKQHQEDAVRYVGGFRAKFGAWGALAVGMYEEKLHDNFNDMFAFGHIQGLIAELGWAQINGLSAGLGYNTQLLLPEPKKVGQWPLIALNHPGVQPKSDLVGQLDAFLNPASGTPCVVAAKGFYWLAAGITVQAFKVLDIDAVLSIELTDTDDFVIAITALASTFFPRAETDKDAFVLVEIGVVITLDTGHGYLLARGELTPRSFILSRDCHVRGGITYATWLSPSPYAGDFVLSIGGYHHLFRPPAHYPPAPDRITISWEYDTELGIRGEAYFAVTPACFMGGARLDAHFDNGWLRAYFCVWADFFVQLHPFWFDVNVGFRFSAEVHIGSGILAINLGPVGFGADMHLWGPSVSGTAKLHFFCFSHTVYFGSTDPSGRAPKLEIDGFLRLVKNQDDHSSKSSTAADAPIDDFYLFSILSGTVSQKKAASEQSTAITSGRSGDVTLTVAHVRGSQLEMTIQTRVPVLSAVFNKDKDGHSHDSQSLFAAPMQLDKPFTLSQLLVLLVLDGSGGADIQLDCTPIHAQDVGSQANAPPISHVMGYSVRIHEPTLPKNGLPVITFTAYGLDDVKPTRPPPPLVLQKSPVIHNVPLLDPSPTAVAQRALFAADVATLWKTLL